ncbi:MAG TPA: triose-phosphate isomerase [Gaiellales bacterium]|jgi:triosephosphate isomerase|nr:triose-phosphate isomerase [Gaiellales bacterium]
MERTPLVAGNWKMFKSRGEAAEFCTALLPLIEELDEVDLAICPPFTSIDLVAQLVADSGVGVWGQNAQHAPEGPFTGEISCPMLIDAGATGVLLGHSERRALFGETDEALALKVAAALASGLEPVLCIGESEAERDGGATESRLTTQLGGGLAGLGASQVLQVTIAYEPVWAIGTGRSATPEIAQDTHRFIRSALTQRYGEECGAAMRILYGGSVKPDNAAELLAQPDVDGALVGGASLDPQSFAAIGRAALAG